MFSKCANPEDGGGVKRIIMGLDRHSRYATIYYLHEAKSSLTLRHTFFPVQDTLRFLFCRILYARGSAREHAIHIWHKTGRANNPLRLGSRVQGRQAVWTWEERWPGMHYFLLFLACTK
jgi:hypothetical protein